MNREVKLGEIIDKTLWLDSETAFKISSYRFAELSFGNAIEVFLERVLPYPHIVNDPWYFNVISNNKEEGEIIINLGIFEINPFPVS